MDKNPIKGILVGLAATFAFVAAWCLVALTTSCTAPLTHEGAHNTITNAVRIVAEVAVQVREARRDAEGEPGGGDIPDPGQSAKPAASGGAPALMFKWGGFHGENAVEDPAVQIGSVRMSRSGMSYKWTKGSLRNWGLADGDAGALACAFYWDDSSESWVGGKFDWISTSRTTRDFKNINDEHYGGWNPDLFWRAKRRAFCIVSKDGRKRTNLAEEGQ